MLGVNLPMHFMIRPAVEDVEVLVDPFNAGEIICVEDAEALLSPLYGDGSKVEIDRTFFNDNKPKPRSFLTRMLTNLKVRGRRETPRAMPALLLAHTRLHRGPDTANILQLETVRERAADDRLPGAVRA
jgi:regulator of sirC expression with transglutaminase-like and TPR domain